MGKIKILEIIGDATLAGAPRHLLSLLENFDYEKFDLFVISTAGPLAGEIKTLKKPINLEIIPMHSRHDLTAIREIRAAVKQIKPELAHVHGTRAGILGRLALIGLKIPVIYTEHLWTKQYRLPGRFGHNIQLFGLWFLDMFTTYNIAVSGAVKDFLIENQITRPEKVSVIYNGVEAPRKKAKPFSRKDEYLLGSIGTLNEQKGMQYLVRAMPRILEEFPHTKLVIVGEGYYKDKLAKLAKELKLTGHVRLTGFVNDVYDELAEMDVYIQPSYSESFGLAILQAMSMGLPIVATNVGGIPEVVTADKTGFLVLPKDSEAIAEAVLELLRNQPEAVSMGEMGEEDANVMFSLEDMVKETEKLYVKIAEERS